MRLTSIIKAVHNKSIFCRKIAFLRCIIVYKYAGINFFWIINKPNKFSSLDIKEKLFTNIFELPVNIQNSLNWYHDYKSNYTFPRKRFYNYQLSDYFDKNVDVKNVWELSRFTFAIKLGQSYYLYQNAADYELFKKVFYDWAKNNPFLIGINWTSPMEAAIRAVNWIIALNLFKDKVKDDIAFARLAEKLLIHHAHYISNFTEIYKDKHTNNHTTANYTGLLFIALTLPKSKHSKKWLNKAYDGLKECMEYQVRSDGVDFENSIPYHRYVLEMFGYAVIALKLNKSEFPDRFYSTLFKMFEYTSAYINHKGIAPQIGDNDSGRFIKFNDIEDHDHSYVLDLGKHIFDYTFQSNCNKTESSVYTGWIPDVNKINIDSLEVKPRNTDESITFDESGMYILKSTSLHLVISNMSNGSNGLGAHEHLDNGSFYLSFDGVTIITDPGTYSYTMDFKKRNLYRDIHQHNVPIAEEMSLIDPNQLNIWRLPEKHKVSIPSFDNHHIRVDYYNLIQGHFNIIDSIELEIEYNWKTDVLIRYHLPPWCQVLQLKPNEVNLQINDLNVVISSTHFLITPEEYSYSHTYGNETKSKRLIFQPGDSNHNNSSIITIRKD